MTTAPAQVSGSNLVLARLFKAAWWSILLGIGVQVLIIIALLVLKKSPDSTKSIVETAGKMTWSTIVCVGVAIGLAVSKMRPPVMGFLGLFAAPLAFWTAKTVQKSLGGAMNVAASMEPAPNPWAVAALKAAQYAALGAAIGWLSTKPFGTLRNHILIGFAVAVVFGGSLVALQASAAGESLTTASLVTKIVNELAFPIGCSIVLYASKTLAKRMS